MEQERAYIGFERRAGAIESVIVVHGEDCAQGGCCANDDASDGSLLDFPSSVEFGGPRNPGRPPTLPVTRRSGKLAGQGR